MCPSAYCHYHPRSKEKKKAYPSNIKSYKQQARLNPFPVVEIAVAVKKEVKV
jgi:hypothetical protein